VPTAGRRLRFQFRDEMLSDETKKETTRIVAKRLESFGVRRFSIRVLDDQLIVETGHFAPARHKAMKRTIHQRGELVVARLDDGVSLNDPTLQAAKLPAGVRLVLEEAYHGPERYTSRRFAQTIPVAGETELEARRKLAAWCATVQLDENHRIVLGEARNGDGHADGWRSYVLWRTGQLGNGLKYVELERSMFRQVYASVDNGSWLLNLQFNELGSKTMTQLSAAIAERRLAIIFDGTVQLAPLVLLTSNDEVARLWSKNLRQWDARWIAAVANGGALPAALEPTGLEPLSK